MDITREKRMVEIYDSRTGEAREQFLDDYELTHERVELYRQIISKLTPVPEVRSLKFTQFMEKMKRGEI